MKRNCKRGISLLLSVCLVLGIFASSGLNLVRAVDAEPKVETVVSGKNLIANGTFGEVKEVTTYANETLPVDWIGNSLGKLTGATVEVVKGIAQDGENSIHVAGLDTATSGNAYQIIALDSALEGKEVVLTAYFKGTVTVKGSYAGLEFRDAANRAISGGTIFATPAVGVYAGWTELTATGTVPAGATSLRIKVQYNKNSECDLYFDNLFCTIGGNEIAVDNASFETMAEDAEIANVKNELVLNGAGWVAGGVTSGTISTVADPADANNAVLKIEDTSANYPTVYYGGFPVEVGASYVFTMKFKVASVDEENPLATTVNLRGNGPEVPRDTNNNVRLAVGTAKNATTEWQTLTIPVDAVPEGVETFYAMLNTTKVYMGIMYIDDVTLTKVCDAHIWGKTVVTAGNCAKPSTRISECFLCGAVKTETTTYAHTWTNGTCSVCSITCEHNAPAGYCLICGMELPKNIIENNMFGNGSFETKTSYTAYPITKAWQLGGEGWYLGGNAPDENLTLAVTNEWSSDGDWALKITDSSNERATSINVNVPVNADGKEKELYMAVDVYAALNDISFTVTPYVGNYNEGGVKAGDGIGPGLLKNYKDGATASATVIIPGNVDSLRVSISSKKAIGETDAERVAQVIIDNLVLTIDGGENLLAGMNGSFEELPVGTAPVEFTVDPVISYPTAGDAYWAGLGDLREEYVAAGCIEEITWESEGNAALYMKDSSTAGTFSVYYYLYNLEKNTSYTLTLMAKKANPEGAAHNPMINVNELGEDGKVIGGLLNDKALSYVKSTEWAPFEVKFTTTGEDFKRVRINFSAATASLVEFWVDDLSLTKDCDHKWENPVVTNENCAFAGKRTVTCACGAIGETELNPCTSVHTLVGATCTIPSYCTVPGCGYIAADALGHDYSNGDGVCARCQHVCGHTYVDEEGNSTNGICFLCGKGCEHTYAEEAVITEATCTDTGVKTIYCPDCDYSATEEIAALGHNFIDNVCQVCGVCCTHEHGETISTTIPTYTSMGEKVSICAVCGEHFTETIPAKFYGTSVNLGNTLDMYFGFYTGLVDEGGKVVFVREFADDTTETTEAPITSFKKNNSVYDITYTGLAAKEMCDTIHVSVYNSEGTLVGQHSDSIRSYILRQLREKDYGAEFRTLCIDLLNYGAAAQIEFGYNADDLANKDLTAEELAEGTQVVGAYTDKQTIDGNATSYYGTAYILETQISMLMAVRADRIGADCYALVSYIDHTGTEKSNIRVEGKKNYSVYEFCLNEIVVADGRCLLTIEFYKADGTKVLTVQDSMESYTARNAADYPLAEKMLAFSDSAYNYLHRNDQ